MKNLISAFIKNYAYFNALSAVIQKNYSYLFDFKITRIEFKYVFLQLDDLAVILLIPSLRCPTALSSLII